MAFFEMSLFLIWADEEFLNSFGVRGTTHFDLKEIHICINRYSLVNLWPIFWLTKRGKFSENAALSVAFTLRFVPDK